LGRAARNFEDERWRVSPIALPALGLDHRPHAEEVTVARVRTVVPEQRHRAAVSRSSGTEVLAAEAPIREDQNQAKSEAAAGVLDTRTEMQSLG